MRFGRRAASPFRGTARGSASRSNEAAVRRHPFEQEIPRRAFGRDGSVIDW